MDGTQKADLQRFQRLMAVLYAQQTPKKSEPRFQTEEREAMVLELAGGVPTAALTRLSILANQITHQCLLLDAEFSSKGKGESRKELWALYLRLVDVLSNFRVYEYCAGPIATEGPQPQLSYPLLDKGCKNSRAILKELTDMEALKGLEAGKALLEVVRLLEDYAFHDPNALTDLLGGNTDLKAHLPLITRKLDDLEQLVRRGPFSKQGPKEFLRDFTKEIESLREQMKGATGPFELQKCFTGAFERQEKALETELGPYSKEGLIYREALLCPLSTISNGLAHCERLTVLKKGPKTYEDLQRLCQIMRPTLKEFQSAKLPGELGDHLLAVVPPLQVLLKKTEKILEPDYREIDFVRLHVRSMHLLREIHVKVEAQTLHIFFTWDAALEALQDKFNVSRKVVPWKTELPERLKIEVPTLKSPAEALHKIQGFLEKAKELTPSHADHWARAMHQTKGALEKLIALTGRKFCVDVALDQLDQCHDLLEGVLGLTLARYILKNRRKQHVLNGRGDRRRPLWQEHDLGLLVRPLVGGKTKQKVRPCIRQAIAVYHQALYRLAAAHNFCTYPATSARRNGRRDHYYTRQLAIFLNLLGAAPKPELLEKKLHEDYLNGAIALAFKMLEGLVNAKTTLLALPGSLVNADDLLQKTTQLHVSEEEEGPEIDDNLPKLRLTQDQITVTSRATALNTLSQCLKWIEAASRDGLPLSVVGEECSQQRQELRDDCLNNARLALLRLKQKIAHKRPEEETLHLCQTALKETLAALLAHHPIIRRERSILLCRSRHASKMLFEQNVITLWRTLSAHLEELPPLPNALEHMGRAHASLRGDADPVPPGYLFPTISAVRSLLLLLTPQARQKEGR